MSTVLIGEAQKARLAAQEGVQDLSGVDLELLTPREIAARIRVIADYLPLSVAAMEEVVDELALRQRLLSERTRDAWKRVAELNHGLDRNERMLAEHQRAWVAAEVAKEQMAIDVLSGREKVLRSDVRAFENIMSAMQSVLRTSQELWDA